MIGLILATVITFHPGGTGAEALRLSRAPQLVIDGPCLSACAWGAWSNSRMCFTGRAVFWFHKFADPGTGREMPAATALWQKRVNRPWIVPDTGVDATRLAILEPGRKCR